MRKLTPMAIALFICTITAPLLAETPEDPAWLTSGLTKGGEMAGKALAGYLYDMDCKTGQAGSAQFICGVLGDFSGRTEAEWKDNVTKKLDEISKDVKAIAEQQKEIQRLLESSNQEMKAEFEALPGKVVIGDAEVKIKSLWGEYTGHFEKSTTALEMNRVTMVNLAKEIMKANLHEKVRNLNTALTDTVVGGKPFLQYPFVFHRIALQSGRPQWEQKVKLADVYTLAEQKFLDYRMLQHRALILYLWAAAVLENDCKLNRQCSELPIARADFATRFENYTRQQITTFNAGVDWFILANSPTRMSGDPNFLGPEPMPVLTRANLLTAMILSTSGGGMWGRVYAMGNDWDGTGKQICGGGLLDLKPATHYQVPVAGSGVSIIGPDSGPLDWWAKSGRSDYYDIVRFATNWTVYHYSVPNAKVGSCTITRQVPLPWRQPATQVVNVKIADPTPEDPNRVRQLPVGSMVGIARAGGTYALVSGNWSGMSKPEGTEQRQAGKGRRVGKLVNIENTPETEWFIGENQSGKQISLFTMARGEYDLSTLSSRIENKDKIQVWQAKNIQFPDGDAVKLNFHQSGCDKCKNSVYPSILQYNVENNPLPTSKGSMTARAAIYFDDAEGGATNLAARGVLVEQSYTDAGETKRNEISGTHLIGHVKTERGKKYRLTYLIEFELLTFGTLTNATEYMYGALIAPAALYLTK
jgi:hypothetical protein